MPTVEGDESVAFKFDGEAWLEAQRVVRAAASSEFKVGVKLRVRRADGKVMIEGPAFEVVEIDAWSSTFVTRSAAGGQLQPVRARLEVQV